MYTPKTAGSVSRIRPRPVQIFSPEPDPLDNQVADPGVLNYMLPLIDSTRSLAAGKHWR